MSKRGRVLQLAGGKTGKSAGGHILQRIQIAAVPERTGSRLI